MNDARRTKKELIDELTELRRQVSDLTTLNNRQNQLFQAEQERRIFSETLHQTSSLLMGSLNFEVVLDQLLEQIQAIVPAEAANVMLIKNGSVHTFRWVGYAQFTPADTMIPVTLKGSDIPALYPTLQRGQPLLLSSLQDKDTDVYGVKFSGIKSHISVPLTIQGDFAGLLNVDSASADFFNMKHVAQLKALADVVASALHNAQLYHHARQEITDRVQALKTERNFVAAVLDTTAAIVVMLNPQGKVLRINRTCAEISGYDLEAITGKYFWDVFSTPNERSTMKRAFEALQKNKYISGFESHLPLPSAKKQLIAWSNAIITNAGGLPEYIISTGINITTYRQSEDRLVGLYKLGQELNQLQNPETICQIVLETVTILLPFKRAGYGILDETSDHLDYSYYPLGRNTRKNIRMTLPPDTPARMKALESADSPTPDALDTQEADSQHFWHSVLMQTNKRTVGVLEFECYAAHPFTPDDLQLIQTLADQTATAVENAQLHREARQRIDELTTMHLISQFITSTLNLEEALTKITDHAIRLLNAVVAFVVLYDETEDNLHFQAVSGIDAGLMQNKRLKAGEGIVGWVIQTGESALVADITQDRRYVNKFDQQTGFSPKSIICAPMRTRQKTIGAIEVIGKEGKSFSEEDLRLLNWLTTPAATAIENARLFEAEHAARNQAEILREATTTLTSSLNLDQVLDKILIHLERVLPYDNAYVFLQTEDWLEIVAERNPSDPKQRELNQRYSADNTIFKVIKESRQPVIIADVKNKSPLRKKRRTTGPLHGWMGVPLTVRNEVTGCLVLNSRQISTYDQLQANLAQVFANQAAMAIHNARLFENVQVGRERLRSLSRRLVEVQEAERRHIARELHDEAGQALTSLMVDLRLLEQNLEHPQETAARIAKLKNTTHDVLENLHRLAVDLRPASLDHLGLVAALQQHIRTVSRQHHLEAQFEVIGLDNKRLPPEVEINLYRIVQEALTNIVRHAKATRADILLEQRGDQMVTIVEDNGIGFDTGQNERSTRLGLLGMRERAEMLGATLIIESTLGTGTTVFVEVPYANSGSDS